jgi:hypothetical protein
MPSPIRFHRPIHLGDIYLRYPIWRRPCGRMSMTRSSRRRSGCGYAIGSGHVCPPWPLFSRRSPPVATARQSGPLSRTYPDQRNLRRLRQSSVSVVTGSGYRASWFARSFPDPRIAGEPGPSRLWRVVIGGMGGAPVWRGVCTSVTSSA